MEAKEYLDLLRDDKAILSLAHFQGDRCDGVGVAVVIDEEHQIAVMLSDCGDANETKIKAGAIVKYVVHPEVPNPKIVGSPAYAVAVILGGQRYN